MRTLRAARTAQDGHCHAEHITVTISPMVGEEVRGVHLRRQRQVGGFSIRELATAAQLSPTRMRQLEAAERVSPRATARYLDAVVVAWRERADVAAREEASRP